MTTFEEAVAIFKHWVIQNRLKPTPRSQRYWDRRFRLLDERVLPVLGAFPVSEVPEILFHSNELAIQDIRRDALMPDQLEALAVAQRVLEHCRTGR
jgi:hypothetical protein